MSSTDMSNSDKQSDVTFMTLIRKYTIFLFDCDGTLWSGSHLIPGALEFISSLQASGKMVFLFSNNATRSVTDLIAKAATFGFTFTEDYVITSGVILSFFLQTYGRKNRIKRLLVLGQPALIKTIEESGVQVVASPGPQLDDQEFSSGAGAPDDADGVVVGFDRTLTYARIARASRLINAGKLFVATNTDPCIPSSTGVTLPGAGVSVNAVATAAERPPDFIMGKPSSYSCEYVLRRIFYLRRQDQNVGETGVSDTYDVHHLSKHLKGEEESKLKTEIIMIGDRMSTDIQFGADNSIDTLLTLTGVTTLTNYAYSSIKATYVVPSFQDLLAGQVK